MYGPFPDGLRDALQAGPVSAGRLPMAFGSPEGSRKDLLQHRLVAVAVGCPEPVAFDADEGESGTTEQPHACFVVRCDATPELMQRQPFAGIAAEDRQRVGGISLPSVLRSVDQDADAGASVEWVEFEEIDRTDGPVVGPRLDDQPQLSRAEDVALLLREDERFELSP